VRKGCRNYWTGILLEHFWCKAILGIQFALLLFLRGLMSSILFFVTGLSFVVRNLCLKNRYWLLTLIVQRPFCGRPLLGRRRSWSKKHVLVTYSNCSKTFAKRERVSLVKIAQFEQNMVYKGG